jgi:HlyD family secretion protein
VPPVLVRTAQATVTTLRPSIDLIGTVVPIPERTSEISAPVEGQISGIGVVEGQTVRADDPLVQLDRRASEARLAGARAAEQKAQATLDKLEHGPRAEEVEAARQTARQLAAVARALNAKFEALSVLHAKDGVSDVEYSQAQARLEAAEAESQAAAAQLSLLEAGTRTEEIEEARAELAGAQAETAAAELAVEFCTIRSPIDGVLTQLAARTGAYVTPADVLGVVVDMTELFVKVRIPSENLPQVAPGARADVSTGPEGQPTLDGRIARLSPQADPLSGDLDGFISVQNDHEGLRPGLACRVRIWLPELNTATVIPAAAVADRDGTPVVTVIQDNKAYERAVTLGKATAEQVQVLDGLQAGDLVAVEGGYALPEGCPVRVESDAPAAEQ